MARDDTRYHETHGEADDRNDDVDDDFHFNWYLSYTLCICYGCNAEIPEASGNHRDLCTIDLTRRRKNAV